MRRKQVVLPEPEGPSMAKNSPSAISRVTPSTARTGPKWRQTFTNLTAGDIGCAFRGSGPTLKGRAEFCWTRYLPIMAIKSFAHCEYGTHLPSCSHLAVGVRQNQIFSKFS